MSFLIQGEWEMRMKETSDYIVYNDIQVRAMQKFNKNGEAKILKN